MSMDEESKANGVPQQPKAEEAKGEQQLIDVIKIRAVAGGGFGSQWDIPDNTPIVFVLQKLEEVKNELLYANMRHRLLSEMREAEMAAQRQAVEQAKFSRIFGGRG